MVKIKHLICRAVKRDKCKHMLWPPPLCSTWELVSPSDILIWDLLLFLPRTANCHLTSACLYYHLIGSISPLLQACPERRQSRCLQTGVFHEEIGWRWRNVLQISPEHLHEESKTHTAAWSQHMHSELLMSWRSLHASVSEHISVTFRRTGLLSFFYRWGASAEPTLCPCD